MDERGAIVRYAHVHPGTYPAAPEGPRSNRAFLKPIHPFGT